MKTKLTVTIDDKVIMKAKRYAQIQGDSLSQIIENQLTNLLSKEKSTFSHKWRGKFVIREKQGDDPRLNSLKEKYL